MTIVQENKSSKFSSIIVNLSTVIGSLLGVLFILVFLAAFNVLSLPLITDDFTAFIGLAIFGFAMCTSVYPIRATLQKDFKWASILTIFAIVLGTLASAEIILVILSDLGIMSGIPRITTYPNAFIIIAVLVFVKWISATIHIFVKI